ncbi:capsule biosynthesis GfcC family protein [Halomonas almeriensis]|uniref:capsule biosynthesis GfcC family protein n=1 Tax=Halomonas almeriensis TaxID=308163 RepID=UPI0025B5E5DF|nr:capsule biosynthesis GfcC family protein [Halomonas almeriensis]MDN3552583.1 capsule biosynthesis GfcC family protein [Halomonas almeriensis]
MMLKTPRLLQAVPLLCLLILATGASAQSSAPTPGQPATLVDAWVNWQMQRQAEQRPPFNWAYSFALRQSTQHELSPRRARLIAEIQGLAPVLEVAGKPLLSQALNRWAERLQAMPAMPARSPEALGLLSLASELRRNPPMSEIAFLGTCQAPSWVEVWSQAGVERLAWRPNMTVESLIARLPASATRQRDRMSVITPRGNVRTRGIADWNRQPEALAPGARVAIRLPESSREARAINRELAHFLATRLPGDDCSLWPK